MNVHEFPGDALYQKWLREYGTTGVKNHVLSQAENEGCVAVYREMSMADRQALARVETVVEEHPGAFQKERMLVSHCLLYPTLDAYPHSGKAAGELYMRVRTQGHGMRTPDDEVFETEKGVIPEYMLEDVRNARAAASVLFTDSDLRSIYTDIVVDLCTGPDGMVRAEALHTIWQLTPGQVRDLAAIVEQINGNVRRETMKELQGSTDYNPQEKQQIAEQVAQKYASPYSGLDSAVGDAAFPKEKPKDSTGPESNQQQNSSSEAPQQYEAGEELPPNRPVRPQDMEGIARDVNRR